MKTRSLIHYAKNVDSLVEDAHCVLNYKADLNVALPYIKGLLEERAQELLNYLSVSSTPTSIFEVYYRVVLPLREKYFYDGVWVRQLASSIVKDHTQEMIEILNVQEIFELLMILDNSSGDSSHSHGRNHQPLLSRYINLTQSSYDLWRLRVYLMGGGCYSEKMLLKIQVKLMDISTNKIETMKLFAGVAGIFAGRSYHDVVYSNIERRIDRELSKK